MKALTLLSILAAGMTIVAGSPIDTSTGYVVPVGDGTSPVCTSGKMNVVCLRDTVKRSIGALFSGNSNQVANANVKRSVDTSFSYLERDIEASTWPTKNVAVKSGFKGPRSEANINQRDIDDISVQCNPSCPPGFKGPRSEADINARHIDDTFSTE